MSGAASAATGSKLTAFMNHPAGPKTVFFWAPLMKWCLVAAGVKDLGRPAEKLSVSQSVGASRVHRLYLGEVFPGHHPRKLQSGSCEFLCRFHGFGSARSDCTLPVHESRRGQGLISCSDILLYCFVKSSLIHLNRTHRVTLNSSLSSRNIISCSSSSSCDPDCHWDWLSHPTLTRQKPPELCPTIRSLLVHDWPSLGCQSLYFERYLLLGFRPDAAIACAC